MIKDLILKSNFVRFCDSWEIEYDTDKKEAFAFEKFVNFCILSQDDSSAFTGNPDLLDFCCTGGGDDAKLDGVGIKINGRLVENVEDIEQIVTNSKKIDVEFFLIQSKERTDFDSAEFNTFGIGVQNFFSSPNLPENESVKALRRLKDYLYNETSVIKKLEDNPSVSVYYVFCGNKPDDAHTQGIMQIVEDNLEKCPDSIGKINVSILGAKELKALCKEIENDFVAELNVCDIIPLSVKGNNLIKKAYSFTCDAQELLKLLRKEDDTIRRSLFNDNVRDYLGNKGGVNSEIEKTIVEEPEMFLMCNNGITIVCSDFLQVRDKLVTIHNPQIVNGCQTCNSIFALRNVDSVSRVQVLIKLICTEEFIITNKVVRGTNKQNLVLEESFETTKPFHQELEEYFIAKRDVAQLYYERRIKQYSSIPTINRYQIINLRVITQTIVGMFLQEPHVAHRHEAKLLEMYAKDGDRKIYKEGQSYAPYYVSALTWFKFEEAFRKGILKKKNKPYKAHLYMIFLYTTGTFPLPLDAKKDSQEKFCLQLEKILISDEFQNIARKVQQVFEHCFVEWTKGGNSRYSIKEKKEFTELIQATSRSSFVNKSVKFENLSKPEPTPWARGEILSIRIRDGKWFAFIKTGNNTENVYFDSHAYKGDFNKLIPGKKVLFQYRSRYGKENMQYAIEVKLYTDEEK